jgi:hypothetical protein
VSWKEPGLRGLKGILEPGLRGLKRITRTIFGLFELRNVAGRSFFRQKDFAHTFGLRATGIRVLNECLSRGRWEFMVFEI